MKIRENVPIAELVTMRIGGVARYVVEVGEEGEVGEAYEFARRGGDLREGGALGLRGKGVGGSRGEGGLPVFVLGGGANTIGRDEGFEGVVILNRLKGVRFEGGDGGGDFGERVGGSGVEGENFKEAEEVLVTAGAGEEWDAVVGEACRRGLTGVEGLSAIPGTVGAAPVQNIGAYGQEVGEVVERVRAYDSVTGEVVEFTNEEMKFGYRRSIFNREEAGRYLIMSVTLRLRKGAMRRPFYRSLEKYIEETGARDFSPAGVREMVRAVRAAKLPDPRVEASAGSFFKNVYLGEEGARAARERGVEVWGSEGGAGAGSGVGSGNGAGAKYKVNAGWLIEAVGLKGKLLHGMRVSEKAALILINESARGYADLAAAREEIRGRVREVYGYELEQEPVEIGGEGDFRSEGRGGGADGRGDVRSWGRGDDVRGAGWSASRDVSRTGGRGDLSMKKEEK